MQAVEWVAANSKQALETLHFIAFAAGIGAIMAVSLRLLGLGRGVPIAALCRSALRVAWLALAAVLVTGTLQLVPIAAEVLRRPSFQAKIAVLACALAVLVLWPTVIVVARHGLRAARAAEHRLRARLVRRERPRSIPSTNGGSRWRIDSLDGAVLSPLSTDVRQRRRARCARNARG